MRQRLLEHDSRGVALHDPKERQRQLQCDLGMPLGVVDKRQRFTQSPKRACVRQESLGMPQFHQHVEPRLGCRRLGQRAPQIGDRDLWRAARERRPRRRSERFDDPRVTVRLGRQEMGRNAVGGRSVGRQQTSRLRV